MASLRNRSTPIYVNRPQILFEQWRYMPLAIYTNAAPAHAAEYDVLPTTSDVRCIYITTTHDSGAARNIRINLYMDGEVIVGAFAPVQAVRYYHYIDPITEGVLNDNANVWMARYQDVLFAQTLRVTVETVAGGVLDLVATVRYDTL